jgi:magnesium transporter
LEFKKTTDLHHDILDSLFHRGRALFGDEFSRIIESIMLDYLKINSAIKNNLESLRELRDTNNSMLSTKQNETMRQLTVMGFITLPLSLIAWIFAMRTEGMPLITNPNAFWIVLTIMATVAIITLVYAWHKKWL